jgi:hypothetical protein
MGVLTASPNPIASAVVLLPFAPHSGLLFSLFGQAESAFLGLFLARRSVQIGFLAFSSFLRAVSRKM